MKKANASQKSAVTQPKKFVTVPLYLPPDLLACAEDHAYHLNSTLSDNIRDLLEYERFRDTKEYYSTASAAALEAVAKRRFDSREAKEARKEIGAK
jgi:hypothetical protein